MQLTTLGGQTLATGVTRGDSSLIRILTPVAENALRPQDAAQFE